MRTDTDDLLRQIDEVIAETLQLFGDHDPAEAKRQTLENAYKLRSMSKERTHDKAK